MSKKKQKRKIVIVSILIVLMLISLSEAATLRAEVFVSFAPIKAFTMEFEESKRSAQPKNTTIYIIRENVPVERSTQGELTTWAVKSIGPFHYAYYYGEG